ncbi:MAG TPA: hypothetical protein IAA09_10820 [Candidatus Lachnoclostridium avicola]|nr:hypothetical protein [Candidatus Lachnoclostridium avicola]
MENMDYGSGYNQYSQNGETLVPEPTVKDFLIWLLVPSVLGCVTCGIGSLILLIVWACSGKNHVRSNFAKAQLIVMVISVVLIFILYMFFGAALLVGMNSYY